MGASQSEPNAEVAIKNEEPIPDKAATLYYFAGRGIHTLLKYIAIRFCSYCLYEIFKFNFFQNLLIEISINLLLLHFDIPAQDLRIKSGAANLSTFQSANSSTFENFNDRLFNQMALSCN